MENTYIGMMGGKKQRLESADQANFQCLHQKKSFICTVMAHLTG